MVKYNKVNLKLSDSRLNKPKATVKNQTGATLRMNIKMFNRNNLPHELSLTPRQKTKLRNAFKENIQFILLPTTQKSKIIQFGGFLLSLLSKITGLLLKVEVALAKHILAQLGITAAASAIDRGIQKKIPGSGTTTLIISNREKNDIMKIVQVQKGSII